MKKTLLSIAVIIGLTSCFNKTEKKQVTAELPEVKTTEIKKYYLY